MKRKTLFVFLLILFVFACSFNSMAKDPLVIKYAHINNPGMAAYDAAIFMSEKVEELSGGEMIVEVYPSAQLGGDRDMVESNKIGTIHINHPNIATLTLSFPRIGLYVMPFLFKDYYHVKRMAESPVGQELNKQFEEATGLRMVLYYTEAPRGLFTNKGPVYEPEDIKGKKIRIMESELYRDMFGTLGAGGLPTPLPYTEVYTSLATNLIEYADPPIDAYVAQKFYEVAKYFSLLDHVTGFKAVTVNAKWFDGLTKEQQDILLQAFKETEKFQNDLSDAQQRAVLDWATSNGVRVNFVNKEAFKKAMAPVYDKWIEKLGKDFATKFIEKANELANP
jgi:tripartite ATP-independent transporter DctP family solute receptor